MKLLAAVVIVVATIVFFPYSIAVWFLIAFTCFVYEVVLGG